MEIVAEDSTRVFEFNTRQFSTGAPFTLAGTPSLAVRIDGGATEVTAGITLTVDFDGKTGRNKVSIDLSSDAAYAAGARCEVFIAAGTVDSVSVVGETVDVFQIGTSGSLDQAITRILLALPAVAPANNGGVPTVDGSNRIAGMAGTINTLDELDTAQDSQHSTTQSSLANKLNAADYYLRRNTAQAGGASTITLDAGAPSTNVVAGQRIKIVSGTGVGQTRIVTSYDGGTKVATVSPAWTTVPDNTSIFVLEGGSVNISSWRQTQPNTLQSGRVDSHIGSEALSIATNQTAILNRLGAFAGSGVNTVLGFFQALFRKDASTPSDIGGTYSPSTDSEEAQQEAFAAHVAAYTTARAGYIDKLNIAGTIAQQSDIQGITQAQRVRVLPPMLMERPDSSSVTYRIYIYAYDEQHKAEDLDSNPTVTAENNAGTDRSTNLGTVTKPGATTGVYYVDYTVASGHAIEQIIFKVDATEGAVTTQYSAPTFVVDTTAIDFTAADRAKLDELHDNRLTSARAGYLDKLNVSGTLAHTDNANSFKADVSLLALEATAQLIKAKTDGLPADPADASDIAASFSALNDLSAAEIRTAIGLAAANLDTQLSAAALESTLQSVLAIVGTTGVVVAAASKSGYSLTTAERDAIANAILDLSSAIDSKTLRQALRYIAAVVAGKASGAGSGTETFKGLDGVTDRVQALVDSSGNRTSISLDP